MLRITLVAPGLLSLPADVLSRNAALARIAAIAAPVQEPDLASAVLDDVGLDAAAAPLAALGAGVDVGNRWTMHADPVSIVVGRDDARIDDLVDDLTCGEADALAALLNTHFAPDGVSFIAPRPDAWFALTDAPQSVRGVAADLALGASLRPLLPSGADAARWRRWLTETQMLLHAHPLAERRRPVNSLWFSGGGRLPANANLPRLRVQAMAGRDGDLVRGIGRLSNVDAASIDSIEDMIARGECDVVVIAPNRVDSPDALATFERDFVVPSLDALGRSQVSAVRLIASDRRTVASWTARRTSWLERWMRRRSRFAAPAPRTDASSR